MNLDNGVFKMHFSNLILPISSKFPLIIERNEYGTNSISTWSLYIYSLSKVDVNRWILLNFWKRMGSKNVIISSLKGTSILINWPFFICFIMSSNNCLLYT